MRSRHLGLVVAVTVLVAGASSPVALAARPAAHSPIGPASPAQRTSPKGAPSASAVHASGSGANGSQPSPGGSGPHAAVSLSGASASLIQTGDAAWTLTKTGTLDLAAKSVSWTITATKVSTAAGQLVITGAMSLTNTGGAGAPIGNILVNLQTRSGSKWATRSSDVADGTSGDAATSAAIDPKASSEHLGTFTENAASGDLTFSDPTTKDAVLLSPEMTIAPGATLDLVFSAAYDNTVLGLATGTSARAEVIVSFGNASPHGPSAANVDINGNGVIDADEAWVRSVPARLGLTVPAPIDSTASPTLTDTSADITTTGTVTFSNATFSLGATSGTASADYAGGTSGGTITNCAHLTGTGAADVTACDSQTIAAATTCTPGTIGCPWQAGDLTTYDQNGWPSAGSTTLSAHFNTVYSSNSGEVEVGIPGTSGFSMVFDSANAVLAYLPAIEPAGTLTSDELDPTTTTAGVFGGDVLALQLDVDFSDAGYLAASSGLKLGDLTVCGLTSDTDLNGKTVRQVLSVVNTKLGGGTTTDSVVDLDPLTADLGGSFNGGTPSTFAQQHLENGACGWHDGDLTTYTQAEWSSGTPATLVSDNFDAVYTSGQFLIGTTSGFSAVFTAAFTLLAYLPANGAIGPLDANLTDPTTTSSGAFGGEVAALKLNVDFSDAGFLAANSGLKFGDLTICGLTSDTDLNSKTVRQFLGVVNTALSGASTTDTITDLAPITSELNSSFELGTGVGAFAQDHLVDGTCP